jgi:hypothetical protein
MGTKGMIRTLGNVMTEPQEPDRLASVPLADLTLAQLRAYREALRHEADRVSYWRRVVHGRMDVLRAESQMGSRLSLEQLSKALADTGSGAVRAGLMRIEAAEPLPDLPALDQIWSDVDTRDETALAAYLHRLEAGERQLNAYRDALHRRVDAATAELIGRYRADPTQALALLHGRGGPVGG